MDEAGVRRADATRLELAAARFDGLQMTRTYRQSLAFHRERMGLSLEDADREALEPAGDAYLAVIDQLSADQVSWWEVRALFERDPDLAGNALRQVRGAARDELDSGRRAMSAFDVNSNLWEQSQFLAVRAAFREEWQPRGGIEDALLDTLAQAYTGWQSWLNRLHLRSELESKQSRGEDKPYWEAPRVSDSEAVREAAEMAERFHRLFIRGLRTLREHRRHAPQVVVQNAGQVNVAEQQVNVG